MNTNLKLNLSRTCFFALALVASTACHAWHGGGYHGGGYHGGGYYGGGYHNNYYRGGYYGGGWGGWGSGVSIGIPIGGYYGATYGCRNVRVCNNFGNCWYQRAC